MNLPAALVAAAALMTPWAGANDAVGLSRADLQTDAATTEPTAQPAVALATNSRGVPTVAGSSQAAPARPAAPLPTSRADSGTIARSTISEVLSESSHLVVVIDTTPAQFRYTGATQFMDERGGVLSADAVKAGTNVTLYFTRTDGDRVLTKVVVNGAAKPLVGRQTQALTEVQLGR